MQPETTREHHELQDELRAYFARILTPAVLDEIKGSEGGGPRYREALEKMRGASDRPLRQRCAAALAAARRRR